MLLNILQQNNGLEDVYRYKRPRKISWCGAVCATLNMLFVKNHDRAVSFQIANEGGIKLIVDEIGEYVKPVSLPLTESINPFPGHIELKAGDILAHLAIFPVDDGKLPLHYAADRGDEAHKIGRMAVLEHLLKVYPEATSHYISRSNQELCSPSLRCCCVPTQTQERQFVSAVTT
jgi:hypothetical protein